MKKLIGKDDTGKWRTSPSASYPSGLCKYLASIIASVPRHRGVYSVQQQQTLVDAVQQQQTEQQTAASSVKGSQHCE